MAGVMSFRTRRKHIEQGWGGVAVVSKSRRDKGEGSTAFFSRRDNDFGNILNKFKETTEVAAASGPLVEKALGRWNRSADHGMRSKRQHPVVRMGRRQILTGVHSSRKSRAPLEKPEWAVQRAAEREARREAKQREREGVTAPEVATAGEANGGPEEGEEEESEYESEEEEEEEGAQKEIGGGTAVGAAEAAGGTSGATACTSNGSKPPATPPATLPLDPAVVEEVAWQIACALVDGAAMRAPPPAKPAPARLMPQSKEPEVPPPPPPPPPPPQLTSDDAMEAAPSGAPARPQAGAAATASPSADALMVEDATGAKTEAEAEREREREARRARRRAKRTARDADPFGLAGPSRRAQGDGLRSLLECVGGALIRCLEAIPGASSTPAVLDALNSALKVPAAVMSAQVSAHAGVEAGASANSRSDARADSPSQQTAGGGCPDATAAGRATRLVSAAGGGRRACRWPFG